MLWHGTPNVLVAVEVDELLYKALATQFSTDSHIQLLNADILKLELHSLLCCDTERARPLHLKL